MSNKLKVIAVVGLLALSLGAVAVKAYAQGNGGTGVKPGWGFGDTNHIHTGPPGESVFPGNTTK